MNARICMFFGLAAAGTFFSVFARPAYSGSTGYAYPIDSITHSYCSVTGINDAGQVVGFQYINAGEGGTIGFLTGPKGLGIKPIRFPGMLSRATAVNSKGQVAGVGILDDGVITGAFITDADGENIRGLDAPLPFSGATGINDSGQVVGNYFDTNNKLRAFITGPNGVGFKDIGTLGGPEAEANAVNAKGQVIGQSTIGGNPGISFNHAFITGPNGEGIRDLGLLGGGVNFAYGLNSIGQVVGAICQDPADHSPAS